MDYDALRACFTERFPESGNPFVCRAPGRVNLIGEHTDYNGLPVLPMAIEREIAFAFTPVPEPRIRLSNLDPRFPDAAFDNGPEIPPSAQGAWENYVKAAVQGMNAHFGFDGARGFDAVVCGDLPAAAGLASSSALVVAASLAYLAVMDYTLDRDVARLDLAGVLARAERYVGTQGGGMDQAVILCAGAGNACKIDFHPLQIEPAPVFEGYAFVVCDSGVRAEKTGSARERYNEGPRLCRLITALVERRLQMEIDGEFKLDCLGSLTRGLLCLTHQEATGVCMRAIPGECMTAHDVAQLLGCDAAEVAARWLDGMPEPAGGFPLRARLRHQLGESRRVELARDALQARDPELFGSLMNDSHESCARDYAISCPELDALVEVAREAGALGARLTGAGFGGATVSLVPGTHVGAFCDAIRHNYYEACGLPPEAVRMLVASPAAGASYF